MANKNIIEINGAKSGNLHRTYLSLLQWTKMFNLFIIISLVGSLVLAFRHNYIGYILIGSITVGVSFLMLGFGIFHLSKFKKQFNKIQDIESRKKVKERFKDLYKLSWIIGKGWATIGNFGKGMYIEDAGKKDFSDKAITNYSDIFYGEKPKSVEKGKNV